MQDLALYHLSRSEMPGMNLLQEAPWKVWT